MMSQNRISLGAEALELELDCSSLSFFWVIVGSDGGVAMIEEDMVVAMKGRDDSEGSGRIYFDQGCRLAAVASAKINLFRSSVCPPSTRRLN
jgi:hypothetical protein